jgi:hypothetical protein
MNLNEINGVATKLVYEVMVNHHYITSQQLMAYIGISDGYVRRSLRELIKYRYVKRIAHGVYSVISDSQTVQGDRKTVQRDRKTVQEDQNITRFSPQKSQKSPISKVKFKKESKVKKENLEKEKKPTTDGLLNLIPSDKMPRFSQTVGNLWLQFRETGFSPDLLHRIAFAVTEFFITKSELNSILVEANNALKATDKTRIKKRWILISKRIQKIYESEGYEWTPCRQQHEAWLAEKKLAWQEKREPRFELFPMELDKQQQHKQQAEKQPHETSEQERLAAEEAKRKFFAGKLPKTDVKPSVETIDLPSTPESKKKEPLKPAARVLPPEPKQNNNVRKAAARVLPQQEIKDQKLKEFINESQKKSESISKKIAKLTKEKEETEQKKLKAAEKVVEKEFEKKRIVKSEIPVTDDDAVFRCPELVKRAK